MPLQIGSTSLQPRTFPELIRTLAECMKDRTALYFYSSGLKLSFSELYARSVSFASVLSGYGIGKGDRVVIALQNSPEWFVSFFAIQLCFATAIPVNPHLRQRDAAEALDTVNPAAIITDGSNDLFIAAAGDMPNTLLISTDSQTESMNRCSQSGDAQALDSAVSPEDVACILFTSGSAGYCKGVMLSHGALLRNADAVADRLMLGSDDRVIASVPMFHCFGIVLTMATAFMRGASVYPMARFSPNVALDIIRDCGITVFNGVPAMFRELADSARDLHFTPATLRTGIMAGSLCPPSLMDEAKERLNIPSLVSVYGLSEASPACIMSSVCDSYEVRRNTVGKPLEGVSCTVDSGSYSASGEIIVSGYNIMRGYFNDAAATAAVIDSSGRLHTGDIGYRRTDGNYVILGRADDTIIRNGENISPREVENAIMTHPKVRDCSVFALPDQRSGEELCAWVATDDNYFTEDELREYLSLCIARYKIPKYIEAVAKIPRNSAGKADRAQMLAKMTQKQK